MSRILMLGLLLLNGISLVGLERSIAGEARLSGPEANGERVRVQLELRLTNLGQERIENAAVIIHWRRSAQQPLARFTKVTVNAGDQLTFTGEVNLSREEWSRWKAGLRPRVTIESETNEEQSRELDVNWQSAAEDKQ